MIDINDLAIIIFSKDRAMQCQATLMSLHSHCKDIGLADINVLYTTSSDEHMLSYETLQKKFFATKFYKEINFKKDVCYLLTNKKYVMFLVDDCIFTNNFSIDTVLHFLKTHDETIGFSLRLGLNTEYCYPYGVPQSLGDYVIINNTYLYFNWTEKEYDFGYPLELSSSVYRVADILSPITFPPYNNPNQLEAILDASKGAFVNNKKYLLSYANSVAFCNPINKVQNVANNRSGSSEKLTPDALLNLFNMGYKIDISKFNGFISTGCHQEFNLTFIKE